MAARPLAAPAAAAAGAPALPPLPAGRPLALPQLLRFERKGHVATRKLLSAAEAAPYAAALSGALAARRLDAFRHRVAVLCPRDVARAARLDSVDDARRLLREHAADDVGFLQVFNLHREDSAVGAAARALVASARLGAAAAQLLGVPRVRLYQSCVFIKEPGMGDTNWHSDLNMVPLDTNAFVTAWLPLRSLRASDAALAFASGSHRDFALPYWQDEAGLAAGLGRRGYEVERYAPLALGDATWHAGWTLHSAPGQPASEPARVALAASYFADGAKRLSSRHLRRQPHSEDAATYADWLPSVREGEPARHAALPLVFDADDAAGAAPGAGRRRSGG